MVTNLLQSPCLYLSFQLHNLQRIYQRTLPHSLQVPPLQSSFHVWFQLRGIQLLWIINIMIQHNSFQWGLSDSASLNSLGVDGKLSFDYKEWARLTFIRTLLEFFLKNHPWIRVQRRTAFYAGAFKTSIHYLSLGWVLHYSASWAAGRIRRRGGGERGRER